MNTSFMCQAWSFLKHAKNDFYSIERLFKNDSLFSEFKRVLKHVNLAGVSQAKRKIQHV